MNFLPNVCDKALTLCFYLLFFLVPLAFTSATSELFEFNKMWLTYAFTILIILFWTIKMIAKAEFRIQKTVFDIPIFLFLASQIVSTFFSIDPHISLWGYYSRFNGGLLSIIAYILLYYAFVSNFRDAKRFLVASLLGGLVVAAWGLPSHFGYDPTCLLLRGDLSVSCWTAAFQPKVRIFSTLGQPNWLAAYLAVLIPIAIAFALTSIKSQNTNPKQSQSSNNKNGKRFGNLNLRNWNFKFVIFLLIATLFYVDLLLTKSRSGFLGLGIGLAVFFAGAAWISLKSRTKDTISPLIVIATILLTTAFVVGTPVNENLTDIFSQKLPAATVQKPDVAGPALETGGTESGKIRSIVWKGAIEIFKNNPLIGTGVETFAFAYYRYRPVEHNLTSEWDFLYNKAHNEYLNYLATTGIFGLGSYLLMITAFIFISIKQISKSEFLISKKIPNSKSQLGQLEIRSIRNLSIGLLASYISILVSNFFGFSVVMINIFFFLIPGFFLVISGAIEPKKAWALPFVLPKNSLTQYAFMTPVILCSLFLLAALYRFWEADTAYALGYNLDRAGQYQEAYFKLREAVLKRPSEPVFWDEYSFNSAVLFSAFAAQENASIAAQLRDEAIEASNQLVKRYPENLVFWKTRVRMFYVLSQSDSEYLGDTLLAMQKASELAPTDARILYNLAVLYGQNNKPDKAIEILEKTTRLKPDYRDAYYALSLFYRSQAVDKNGRVVNAKAQQKAEETMRFILTNIASTDAQAKERLQEWDSL